MFKVVSTMDELLKAFTVRAVVFIGEQDCPYNLEIDEHEYSSIHILGEADNEPVAAGRIRFPGNYAKLERIAIREQWRGKNYGHELVDFMIQQSRDRGYKALKMNAQVQLVEFYGKHGFVKKGDIFDEAGIDHYQMVRHEKG